MNKLNPVYIYKPQLLRASYNFTLYLSSHNGFFHSNFGHQLYMYVSCFKRTLQVLPVSCILI